MIQEKSKYLSFKEKVIRIMKQLNLTIKAYKHFRVTTHSKYSIKTHKDFFS